METVASFLFILIIYFLGCLSLVLLFIRPHNRIGKEGNASFWIPDHIKIILISLAISLITTILASFFFVFD